jgi:hypothetical protein
MKKLFFSLLFVGILPMKKAGAQFKVTVYAYVSNGGFIDYRYLKKLLPDSLKEKILLDYRKAYKIKGDEATLYRMEKNGWHLSFISAAGGGANGSSSVSPEFVLTRELNLNEEAYHQFDKLMSQKEE